jgi:type IV pilus assembly protein PilW
MKITRHNYPTFKRQTGVSLVELMVAMTLGILVILAMSNLIFASKSIHTVQIDTFTMDDTARSVFSNMANSIKQAGLINYSSAGAPLIDTDALSPAILGLDASTLKTTSNGIESPTKSLNNSSDVIAIRFFGYGTGTEIDAPLNCAGYGVPAPTSPGKAEADRGWSIYYVANDNGGQPNLYCKYKSKNFTAQSIAEGVESFQILYGIDDRAMPDGTGIQFLDATEINALDANIPPAEFNKKTHWKKIVAIKVAILVRGTHNANLNSTTETYRLFGEDYFNPSDKGTSIAGNGLPPKYAGHLRKVYSATIQLKNAIN